MTIVADHRALIDLVQGGLDDQKAPRLSVLQPVGIGLRSGPPCTGYCQRTRCLQRDQVTNFPDEDRKWLADEFGVSRSPVREALLLLMDEAFLEQQQNRGFFVRRDLPAPPDVAPDENAQPFEEPGDYQTIAEDWLTNRIPAEVTEQYLRDRYALTKTQLGYVLLRAVREGWAERKEGYGWRFLPVAKTPETFEQIYRFRMQIEPAAMLEPGYAVDHAALAEQRRIQQRMLDHEIEHAPGERLLDYGALAKLSTATE